MLDRRLALSGTRALVLFLSLRLPLREDRAIGSQGALTRSRTSAGAFPGRQIARRRLAIWQSERADPLRFCAPPRPVAPTQ
jgi:hypothetical protein